MIAVLENPNIRQLARPLSIKGYHLLRDWGIVAIKTELIRGVVVDKMSKSPLHTYVVNVLFGLLEERLPETHWLRKEDPLTLADSEPEPDISIVKGKPQDFKNAHPTTAEWVIEVAVSSLALDREKATLYAAANIPLYWLVNAEQRCIEVYSHPQQGIYLHTHIHTGDLLAPFGLQIAVQDLFAES